MTLKMAHRVLLRVLWCDVVFPGNLSGLLFAEDEWGGPIWRSLEFLRRLRDTCGVVLKYCIDDTFSLN